KYDEVLQQTARFGIINDNEKSEHRQQHGVQRQIPKGLDDEIFRETTTAASAAVDDALNRKEEVIPKDYVSNLLLHNDAEPPTMIDKSKAADGQLQKKDIPTHLPAAAYRALQHKTKNITLSHTVINAVDNGEVDDMPKRLPPQPSIERP
ncbi:hypothetical protein FOZ62_019062, partial [Perkinsus olseni]